MVMESTPPVDADIYREGMRFLASGVSIIATELEGKRVGLTATAVSSITTDPAQLMVCVNQNASAHDSIIQAGRLSVNVLPAECENVAQRFAGMGPLETSTGSGRFEIANWRTGSNGVPVLYEALVCFECRIVETKAIATHTAFLCEVVGVVTAGKREKPLIYFDGGFAHH